MAATARCRRAKASADACLPVAASGWALPSAANAKGAQRRATTARRRLSRRLNMIRRQLGRNAREAEQGVVRQAIPARYRVFALDEGSQVAPAGLTQPDRKSVV